MGASSPTHKKLLLIVDKEAGDLVLRPVFLGRVVLVLASADRAELGLELETDQLVPLPVKWLALFHLHAECLKHLLSDRKRLLIVQSIEVDCTTVVLLQITVTVSDLELQLGHVRTRILATLGDSVLSLNKLEDVVTRRSRSPLFRLTNVSEVNTRHLDQIFFPILRFPVGLLVSSADLTSAPDQYWWIRGIVGLSS